MQNLLLVGAGGAVSAAPAYSLGTVMAGLVAVLIGLWLARRLYA
jgi:fluoride ion exporter CrcB/FEX